MIYATEKSGYFSPASEIAVREFHASMGVGNFMHARNSPGPKNYGFLYFKKLNCFHAMITIRKIKKILDVIFSESEKRRFFR
jgi:hypothetical protein